MQKKNSSVKEKDTSTALAVQKRLPAVPVRIRRHPGSAAWFTHGGLGVELDQPAPCRSVEALGGGATDGSGSVGVASAQPVRPVLRLRRLDKGALRLIRPSYRHLGCGYHAGRLAHAIQRSRAETRPADSHGAPGIPSRVELDVFRIKLYEDLIS